MEATLHSFFDIFDTGVEDDQETIHVKKIIIPIIQRDYAQGRTAPEIERVRNRFLGSLYKAVTEKPITLDFVYGDIDENGVMTPLDGQQRLTTLFLLHWYASRKSSISEECQFLKNFSYETRYTARDFCTELVDFVPVFGRKISEEIVDQAWFPLDWCKDPTIAAMLVMLDAIDETFAEVSDLWERLKNNAITFYFLPIRDMGMTDELYIKMNSRGKPLTAFEHFKAEFERELRNVDDVIAKRIMGKIDREWTDLLWEYRNGNTGTAADSIIDDEFLRYFKFVCDIICYKGGESPQGKSSDEFDLLNMYFAAEHESVRENVETLERFFDCWCNIPGYDTPTEFLQSFISESYTHEAGKIIISGKPDIFEECLHGNADKAGNISQFPLGSKVRLYAIIIYLQNCDRVTRQEFVRRIRIIENLVWNSEDEVSDRSDRNRIPAILAQVDSIMLTGRIDDSIRNTFNVHQMREEKNKIVFVHEHPEKAELLFELEDHYMLEGQIGIIGLEHLDYAERFFSLFANCDMDKIDCALMSIGDYGQQERNEWRYQYASAGMEDAWRNLFHKSSNLGFENTKDILLKLLAKSESFDNDVLQEIIDDFLAKCADKHEYPWRYYYVNYDAYRPGKYGKLSNTNAKKTPYLFFVMQTKLQWSQNTYMPYLKAADELHLYGYNCGDMLVYEDKFIMCDNDAYSVYEVETEKWIGRIPIKQNEKGIDMEDRVVMLKKYIRTHFY